MKKIITFALASFLFGAFQSAHALDLMATSSDPVVTHDKFRKVVQDTLPPQVAALDNNYRLSAVLETSDYQNGEHFYFYSVELLRKVIEEKTGKTYWAMTSGLRSHGLTHGGDELLDHVRSTMKAAQMSFRLDQPQDIPHKSPVMPHAPSATGHSG